MIEFQNVKKRYADEEVLSDVNLVLKEEQVYILTGVSGIGKTTLLRLLLGLEEPDEGRIVRSGAMGEDKKTPGVVFQEDRLCEDFSAIENVMMTDRSMKKEDAIEELSELLPKEELQKPVRKLSGGQRRRVAIVRAMAAAHSFYVLDEPFNGLDEDSKLRALAYIKKKRHDRMMILAVHDTAHLDFGERIDLGNATIAGAERI